MIVIVITYKIGYCFEIMLSMHYVVEIPLIQLFKSKPTVIIIIIITDLLWRRSTGAQRCR